MEEKVLKKRKYREEKYPEEENNAEGVKITEKDKNAEENGSAVGDSEELPSVLGESVATTTTVDPEEEENPPKRGRKPTTARAERKPNSGKDLEEEKNDEYDGKEKFSSQEYQNFLKEKAKSAFDSLFGNLRMVLDGKKDPSELCQPDELLLVGQDGKGEGEARIRESFSQLRSAIRSLPSSIEDDFRKEFEEKQEKTKKVKVSSKFSEKSSRSETTNWSKPSESAEKVKRNPSVPKKPGRPSKNLTPNHSEQSNQSIDEEKSEKGPINLSPNHSEQSNQSINEEKSKKRPKPLTPNPSEQSSQSIDEEKSKKRPRNLTSNPSEQSRQSINEEKSRKRPKSLTPNPSEQSNQSLDEEPRRSKKLKPISSVQSNQSVDDGQQEKLQPISSEQSNQSVGEKMVTTYFCPVSKLCKFTLTKVTFSCLFRNFLFDQTENSKSTYLQAEMREMVKARVHLTDDHNIDLW